MGNFTLGILAGIAAVLILDTAGSVLALRLNFRYTRLAPLSWLLWVSTGVLASRAVISSHSAAMAVGGLAGGTVGLFDSTIGWWISWRIGAARMGRQQPTIAVIRHVILLVTAFAAMCGILGALAASLLVRF